MGSNKGVRRWQHDKWRHRMGVLLALLLFGFLLLHGSGDGVQEIADFTPNPGHLRMYLYTPRQIAPRPALVVALHGCYQTAAGYARASGWLTQADRLGLILLLPEQRFWNNPMRCFKWFGHAEADGNGEVASLVGMIDHIMAERHIPPERVFITGLSGGSAMAALMLATRPDLFAGGGLIAGVPARCASTVFQGTLCMLLGLDHTPRQWGDLVRQTRHPPRQWPRISIWQGTRDWVIHPDNARELVEQWTNVHGIDPDAQHTSETTNAHQQDSYRLSDGTVVVEKHLLKHGHGQPVDPGHGCGQAGFFFPEAGVCASHQLTRFWGLDTEHGQP
ncbi:MAG: PHB depolymerase family esterase [Magnetococcus sp. DMHC-1]|nr:PHB depolymerase family esterase [Magnetococcales bacterium]